MKNPECPECDGEMSARIDRDHPIFECDRCGYWRYMTRDEARERGNARRW